MTVGWITAHLPLDHRGNVLLAQDVAAPGDSITIPPATLAAMTASVADAAIHAELSALPIASSGGWQVYFDNWKAKRYIT